MTRDEAIAAAEAATGTQWIQSPWSAPRAPGWTIVGTVRRGARGVLATISYAPGSTGEADRAFLYATEDATRSTPATHCRGLAEAIAQVLIAAGVPWAEACGTAPRADQTENTETSR